MSLDLTRAIGLGLRQIRQVGIGGALASMSKHNLWFALLEGSTFQERFRSLVSGTLVGEDKYGNKYYEEPGVQAGRHRWVSRTRPFRCLTRRRASCVASTCTAFPLTTSAARVRHMCPREVSRTLNDACGRSTRAGTLSTRKGKSQLNEFRNAIIVKEEEPNNPTTKTTPRPSPNETPKRNQLMRV